MRDAASGCRGVVRAQCPNTICATRREHHRIGSAARVPPKIRFRAGLPPPDRFTELRTEVVVATSKRNRVTRGLRSAQPGRAALRRRKKDSDGSPVHLAYVAPLLPSTREYGPEVRRAVARERVSWPLRQAQNEFLAAVARLAPGVLRDLSEVQDGRLTLRSWAEKWRLNADWVLAVARNTLVHWREWPQARGRKWDENHDEQGELLPMRGRLPRRPPEILIRPEHLDFLVRRRCLKQKYSEITDPPETARKAVRNLARRLGL